jgi:hypothetical protein
MSLRRMPRPVFSRAVVRPENWLVDELNEGKPCFDRELGRVVWDIRHELIIVGLGEPKQENQKTSVKKNCHVNALIIRTDQPLT